MGSISKRPPAFSASRDSSMRDRAWEFDPWANGVWDEEDATTATSSS
jgi:hypothetical protein